MYELQDQVGAKRQVNRFAVDHLITPRLGGEIPVNQTVKEKPEMISDQDTEKSESEAETIPQEQTRTRSGRICRPPQRP